MPWTFKFIYNTTICSDSTRLMASSDCVWRASWKSTNINRVHWALQCDYDVTISHKPCHITEECYQSNFALAFWQLRIFHLGVILVVAFRYQNDDMPVCCFDMPWIGSHLV